MGKIFLRSIALQSRSDESNENLRLEKSIFVIECINFNELLSHESTQELLC